MSQNAQVAVTSHGSVVTFTPLTEEAKAWFDENVQSEGWQWIGASLGVDHRMANLLAEGLVAEGFI